MELLITLFIIRNLLFNNFNETSHNIIYNYKLTKIKTYFIITFFNRNYI